MLYALACLLAILSGLTCYFAALTFSIAEEPAWLLAALGFGLVASSLPLFKRNRGLKEAMFAIALFAAHTAWITSVRSHERDRYRLLFFPTMMNRGR